MSALPSRTTRTYLSLVAFLLAFQLQAGTARACSCTGPVNLCTEMSWSSAIFAGTVTSLAVVPGSGGELLDATLTRIASWKGLPGAVVTVRTPATQGLCGWPFTVGQSYLLFVSGGPTVYSINLCSTWSRLYNPADPIIPLLGVPCSTPALVTTWGLMKSGLVQR